MKRLLSIFLSLLLCMALFVGACGDKASIYVYFIVDGETYESIEFDGESQIVLPDDPVKEGYDFKGWYFDADTWENELTADYFVSSPATDDVFVYAKWTSSNHNETVKLYAWNNGWNVDGYQAIVDAFNQKSEDENLGITVELEYSLDLTAIGSEFSSGNSDYDIFIGSIKDYRSYKYLEPLDDVLDQKYGNESKTLGQKFNQKELDMMIYDDSIGMLPVLTQVSGIVYNKALFTEGGFSVPRTTDELTVLVEDPDFNTTSHKAWMHYQDDTINGYYQYIMDVWTAQYMGRDNYQKFTKLQPYTDYKGHVIGTDERSVLIAEEGRDGRYETLKVLDDVLHHYYVYSASSAQNFTMAQTAFLNDKAMMMVNDNWLGQEIKKNNGTLDGEKFGMMKTPVISSIIDNLKDDSIKNDTQLCEVIDAIDQGKNFTDANLTFACTEDDYNRIVEARSMQSVGVCNTGMYLANYSKEKASAKEFIKFFYSDEGAKIWESLKGCELAIDYSDESIREEADYYDNWTKWDKATNDIYKTTVTPIGDYITRSKIFVANNLSIFLNVPIIDLLTATNAMDLKTAEQLWEDIQSKINNKWGHWLSAANSIN